MEGEHWMEIRNDRLKGMSYMELRRKYNVDPRTAKRYAESPQRPEYRLTGPKPSKLDEYKHQVDVWLEEALFDKGPDVGGEGDGVLDAQTFDEKGLVV